MSMKYTINMHSKAFQNIPKLAFFGIKINHLATLVSIVSSAFLLYLIFSSIQILGGAKTRMHFFE
jgi:hypothetical protein